MRLSITLEHSIYAKENTWSDSAISLFFLREIGIWHVTEILDKNSALCRNHRFSISFISSRIRGCDTKWKSYQILNFKERERDSYIVTPRCENSRLLICPLTGHYTLELTELIVQRITVSYLMKCRLLTVCTSHLPIVDNLFYRQLD